MSKMSRSEAGRLGAIKTKNLWLSRYENNPKFCEFCKKAMPYEKRHNKFCDHACAASCNNEGICRNGKSNYDGKEKIGNSYKNKFCKWCNKITKNELYCSRGCCSKHKWQEFKIKIEEAGSLILCNDPIYGYSPKIAKRYLVETRSYKCEICNLSEWFGEPIPLVLDHIDGNPTNHKLNNIRLVCGNCNMMLPTFAGRNRGKGRSWRYVDGERKF